MELVPPFPSVGVSMAVFGGYVYVGVYMLNRDTHIYLIPL